MALVLGLRVSGGGFKGCWVQGVRGFAAFTVGSCLGLRCLVLFRV